MLLILSGGRPKDLVAISTKAVMRKIGKEESPAGWCGVPSRALARESLLDAVVPSGLGVVQDELEAELTAVPGERSPHQEQRRAVRSGVRASSLVLSGESSSSVSAHPAGMPINSTYRVRKHAVWAIRWMNEISSRSW